jgi:hypothetical protein
MQRLEYTARVVSVTAPDSGVGVADCEDVVTLVIDWGVAERHPELDEVDLLMPSGLVRLRQQLTVVIEVPEPRQLADAPIRQQADQRVGRPAPNRGGRSNG